MIYALPIILGFISLWHGGSIFKDVTDRADAWLKTIHPKLGMKAVKNSAWAFPFALSVPPLFALPVFAACLAGKAAPHGTGLGLREPLSGKQRSIEILIKWLDPFLPDYWYKVLILSTSGLLAVAGAALAVGWYNPIAGSVIALGGILKGSGYMVGQRLEDRKALLRFYKMLKVRIFSNQIGEFLAGFFAGLGLLFADMLI